MQKHRKFLRRSLLAILFAALVCLTTGALALAALDVTAPTVTNVVPADGSTIYTNGTTTNTSISADYSDEAGGTGVDPSTVMVHLDIDNMLRDCPVKTETHVQCWATVADLPAGPHTLDIYVGDNAGNMTMHHTMFTVAVDNQPPTYSNLSPPNGSTILTSTLTSLKMEFDYSDPAPSSGGVMPMIHVNDSHDGTTPGAMIMGCTKTATHYSCAAVKAKRLHLGSNWMEVLLADKVSNNNYSDPSRLNYYTVVDDTLPAVSGVAADASTISANYSDPEPAGRLAGSALLASGINSGAAAVTIDGTAVSGCTATATSISCPTPSGLSDGTHAVIVSVADNSGNTGTGTGSFTTCTPARPTLSIATHHAFWASNADYTNRELSVRMIVSNNGASGNAYGVAITGASANNGVTLSTATPVALGDIAGGASATTDLKYHVPAGVTSFISNITGSATDVCGTGYAYPTPPMA